MSIRFTGIFLKNDHDPASGTNAYILKANAIRHRRERNYFIEFKDAVKKHPRELITYLEPKIVPRKDSLPELPMPDSPLPESDPILESQKLSQRLDEQFPRKSSFSHRILDCDPQDDQESHAYPAFFAVVQEEQGIYGKAEGEAPQMDCEVSKLDEEGLKLGREKQKTRRKKRTKEKHSQAYLRATSIAGRTRRRQSKDKRKLK